MLPIELCRELRSAAQFDQFAKDPKKCAAHLSSASELAARYGMHHEAAQVFYSNLTDKRIYNAAMLNRIGPLSPSATL